MQTRFLFAVLLAAGSLSALSADAQDKIYLTDGSRVDGRVKEIGPRDVRYTMWQGKDSSDYIVSTRDVARILFENGMEQSFGGRRLSPHDRMSRKRPPRNAAEDNAVKEFEYGKNILSFAPLQMTNESVAGVGIQYERVLDRNGYVSLLLPVAFSFVQDDAYNYQGNWENGHSHVFTYLYPGLKFYPATSSHRVTYSIGPAFGLGFGTRTISRSYYNQNLGGYLYTTEDQDIFKAGFMVNNGLNIQITKAFYLGLEGGLGIFYYDNEDEHFEFGSDEPMAQLNFKMGFRF
jgi:hypothetical protein